jgi:hypothetical protein
MAWSRRFRYVFRRILLRLVDQKNAGWNRIARWLGRIEALRAAA